MNTLFLPMIIQLLPGKYDYRVFH